MADKATILTAEGLAKLEAELETLRTVKRVQNSERIKVAISYGDISENSEYDDAKNEQAFIEGRILELEQMISTATIIDDKGKKKKGVVNLGSTVIIEDMEPDPFDGKISNESPIGAAILGKKVNSVVSVRTPSGDHKYKIVKVK